MIVGVLAIVIAVAMTVGSNKVMTRLMMLFSAGLDVFICLQLGRYLPFSPLILVGIYVLAVLILMLKMYDITRFEHVASGLVASIAVSLSLSSVVMTVHLLEKYPVLFSRSNIVYILLMSFVTTATANGANFTDGLDTLISVPIICSCI